MKIATLALILAASPALADVTVTDGDSIELHGDRVRLFGIDAPEGLQVCPDGWQAGVEASTYLARLIAGHTVECEPKATDRFGRTIAVCRVDGLDLGAAMVRSGHAWAFTRYSLDYVRQEMDARADRAGVHAHDCTPAWAWRAARQRR